MGMRISARTVGVLLSGTLVFSAEARAQQQQQRLAQAEKDVRQTMEDYNAAYGANNLDKYFTYFADDMTTWWNNAGRRDEPTPKKRYMETYPPAVQKSGGYTGCKLEDLRIKVGPSSDAAVASYKQICNRKTPGADGKSIATYWMSSTLFKRPEGWKIVHLHWLVEPAPPAPPPSSR